MWYISTFFELEARFGCVRVKHSPLNLRNANCFGVKLLDAILNREPMPSSERVSHIKLGIKYEHSDNKFCQNPKLFGPTSQSPHIWRKLERLEAWNKFSFILRFPKKCAVFYGGMQEKSKPIERLNIEEVYEQKSMPQGMSFVAFLNIRKTIKK